MSDLHQQLQDSIREAEQIRKIKLHVSQLNARLATELDALADMERVLDKEQRDVEALEREGLTSMFRKFVGDREERLEKEREEYVRASLRYNDLYKSVQLIRYELELLAKKDQAEEPALARIETLIKKREHELIDTDPVTGGVLRQLHSQSDKLQGTIVEIEEALTHGQEAHTLISQTEQYLLNARNLGVRDMWGNNKSYNVGQFKYHALDQARNTASTARHALIRFANELADVYRNSTFHFQMEIEDFGRFGDIFFDNLISDIFTQQKINRSLTSVTQTKRHVEEVLRQLTAEKQQAVEKKTELERQRKDVVLKSGDAS